MSGMVVATRSGRVEYDGRMEEIRAGITWVARGHEILKKAPHLFGQERCARGIGSLTLSGGQARGHATLAPGASPA